ncbi:outer membrane protein [Bradyrhizobium cajani]|nr:outer membrane protein [Bradyrhizobium cajani]MCP3369280.1 porin family protein [Bradyrhizobium cajani]
MFRRVIGFQHPADPGGDGGLDVGFGGLMKVSLLGAIALIAGAAVGSAEAADLAARPYTKAPAPMAAPFTWTGVYAGVQGGYQWSRDHFTEFDMLAGGAASGFGADFKPIGGFGGLHAGYNHQFNRLVLGIEADVDFGRVSGGFSTPLGVVTYDARKNWEASVRGRLGITPIDRLLLYVTGGAAFTELKYHWETSLFAVPPADATISKTGWTAGAGTEVALTDHLTARVEYRYSNFGTTRFDWTVLSTAYEQKPRFQSVRGGISYKF